MHVVTLRTHQHRLAQLDLAVADMGVKALRMVSEDYATKPPAIPAMLEASNSFRSLACKTAIFKHVSNAWARDSHVRWLSMASVSSSKIV